MRNNNKNILIKKRLFKTFSSENLNTLVEQYHTMSIYLYIYRMNKEKLKVYPL